MPHRYQSWETDQTLAEGLAEYYTAYPEFAGDSDFLGQPRATVVAHDVCHVLLGLGASSEEELIVETFTALGCSFPVQEIVAMRKKAFVSELMRIFGLRRLIHRFLRTLPRILRAAWVYVRMPQRWPHFGWQPYQDIPLRELRQRFRLRPR